MAFTIKEYKTYNESEILNLYTSVGWTNYTNHPQMLEKAYANSLKTLGFTMDTNMDCRAFSKYFS